MRTEANQNRSKTEAKQKQDESKNKAEESKEEANKNDNVNENNNNNKKFSFSLSSTKQISNTSKEYQAKLKEYILSTNSKMTFEDFYDSCEMKGYKYKNFKLAFNNWNKKNDNNENKNIRGIGANYLNG